MKDQGLQIPSQSGLPLRLVALVTGALQLVLCLPASAAAPPKPNVIVIFADDLGWHDLGVQGATDVLTPNIDSLARSGIRFTSGYVTAPLCSPSRAGLITGRCQQLFGHEMNPGPLLERDLHFGLPLTETTMGDRMKSLGYATGWIGKSHLGGVANYYHPLKRGFDEFFGFIEGHHEYIRPGIPTSQPDPILRGITPVPETDYLTAAFAREIVDYIDGHAAEPFFLYAPFNAVHFPLEAPPALLSRFDPNQFSDLTRYTNAVMLAALDDAVGAILTKLRALNLETNTLIVFASDNGAPSPNGVDKNGSLNTPLRGYKGDLYEGGIRVPFLMQWKGHLPADAVVDTPVSTLDILPTAVAAAGGSVPAAWQLDGVNLLPFLLGQTTTPPHSSLFWRTDSAGGDDVQPNPRAVRQGDWKAVKPSRDSTWELYNLASDVGETTNLADANPDIVQRLVAAFDAWNAQLATPRWDFNTLNYVTPEFVRQDVRLGAANVSYLQPEFLPGGAQIAFQDGGNKLWRGEIDALTGFFRSASGQDLLVDTGLAPLEVSVNGPEWGLSANGPALFYTKPGSSGRQQVWRARLGNGVAVAQLTGSQSSDSFGVRVSQEPADASVKMAFNVGNIASATMSWADESSPLSVLPLPRHAGGSRNGRWLPDSADIAYSGIPPAQPVPTQIARYRTAAGTPALISNDSGDKTDVCGFLAPEFDGELCYAAVVDHTAIAVYRDLQDNANGLYTRIATLTFPPTAPPRYIYSLEPLQGLRGFNGVSYFTFAAYQNNDPVNPGDSAIWLVGLGPDDDHHVARRVDEGAGSGLVADRREPKTVIGDREVFLYYSRQNGTEPTQLRLAKTGLKRPDRQGAPSGFTSLQFSRSLDAGTTDANGRFMGSTETMNLVAHKGRLFAGTGSRNNLPYPTDPANLPSTWSGAQILVKDSPTAPWRVDDALPAIFRVHLRVEALVDITFTTFANGTALPQPVNLLIAGLSDVGATGSTLASARTRDDATGDWEESHIATTAAPANALSFGSHVDRFTDVHHIFAGLENGEIYRGACSPAAAGKLVWSPVPELSGVGQVTAFAEANGFLYAACGLAQANSTVPVTGGLFVRRDSTATWELVYQWPHPVELFAAPAEDRLMRGLTAVPEPFGAGREVLLAARSWPGVIERIDPDPAQGHTVTVELDVRDFFARLWNDDRVRQSSVTIAYNGFTAVTNPVTGERVHLVGLWIEHPESGTPPRNGSHFLMRHEDGAYEPADLENFTPTVPSGESLRATRCIAGSPFAEDRGGGFYFGGYDTADDESHNTGWIMRGDWFAWPALTITQPDPPDWQLAWPIAETNWVLETSAVLGPAANWLSVPGIPTRALTYETQSVSSQAPNSFFQLRKP